MRLYCLSGDPNYPCLVLTAKGCTIMLDCSLNMKTLQYFLPQMLVPSQRFEAMPFYRNQQTGQQFDNLKDFNNRIFINTTLEFSIPEFNLINVQDIDVVLISNCNAMLALPYLTKMKGFRASIYCTEPVMQFGKMLMDELTHLVKTNNALILNNQNEVVGGSGHSNKIVENQKFPLFHSLKHLSLNLTSKSKEEEENDSNEAPPSKQAKIIETTVPKPQNASSFSSTAINAVNSDLLKQNYLQLAQILNINETHMKPINWKYLYSKEDVDLCLSKITSIEFNEKVGVFGSLMIQAKSSGHSIGSCNWTIESDCDLITYLSRTCILGTHSKSFDPSILKSSQQQQPVIDCLILNGLNQVPLSDPEQMFVDFSKACVTTIKNQGSCLIPCSPTGKIYDLIECLYRYLIDASLTTVPIYFISHVANQSLAYSNIFAEWLCDNKQNLVYAAESPFQHGELVRSGLIKIYPGITSKFNDDFHQPCVLFASHPSLRFGDACHFVEFWKNSPNNSFIFIDPEYNYIDALAPYQPIYANFYYFPIDTSLTPNQFHKLTKENKQIFQLITSQNYKVSNEQQQMDPIKIDVNRLNPNTKVNFYAQNDIIKLNLKRKYENCDIEGDLAAMIKPNRRIGKELNANMAFATFNAQLVTKNNYHVLKAAPKTIPLTRRDRLKDSNLRKYPYGKLNLENFLNALRKNGLSSFKVSDLENSEQNPKKLDILSVDNETLLINTANKAIAPSEPKHLIEFDSFNRITIDVKTNQVNVICDNEEMRVKIKESLLKCLKTLEES